MKKISNFKLEFIRRQTIQIPYDSTLLSFAEFKDRWFIYALVPANEPITKESYEILICNSIDTEEDIETFIFLQTYVTRQSQRVNHVFYRKL